MLLKATFNVVKSDVYHNAALLRAESLILKEEGEQRL